MEPWQSWAIAIAGGGLAYLYYNSQNSPKPTKARASSVSDGSQVQSKPLKRQENKVRRKNEITSTPEPSSSEATASAREQPQAAGGAQAGKKRKAGKKSAPAPTSAPPVAVQKTETRADEDDNRAFAEQLASLKKGTNLAPPTRTDNRNRTVKQSTANANPAVSSASSTNGADADDDLSPALSPSLAAGGVSDMLEAPTPGPSVLRLTESSKPQQTRQQKQQNDFQAAETKKQRQNRQKVEDRRLEREAAEKDRQALLERQRRTAREARGEPARNGVPASKPPAVSAWSANAAARAMEAPVTATSSNSAPLLDTFDQDAESTSSSTGALNNSTAATSTTMASQEDQSGGARDMNDDISGWNTVPKGKKQRKQATATDGDAGDELFARSIPQDKPAPAPQKPRAPQPSVNSYSYLDQGPKIDVGSHPDDSQWSA